MGWSYDNNLTADKDKVRFEIGDVNNNRQLLSNEEISAILTEDPTVLVAAARCAEGIMAKIAGDFDFSADGARFNKSQMYDHYERLTKRLSRRAGVSQATTIFVQRVDGYSDDVTADEVNAQGTSSFDRSGLVN